MRWSRCLTFAAVVVIAFVFGTVLGLVRRSATRLDAEETGRRIAVMERVPSEVEQQVDLPEPTLETRQYRRLHLWHSSVAARDPRVIPLEMMRVLADKASQRARQVLDARSGDGPLDLRRTRRPQLHIPVSAADVGPRLAAVAGAGRSGSHPPLYSSHRCVGSTDAQASPTSRSCVFSNVCLNRNTGEVEYYARNSSAAMPVMFRDGAKPLRQFPPKLVVPHAMASHSYALFSPTVVHREAPASLPDPGPPERLPKRRRRRSPNPSRLAPRIANTLLVQAVTDDANIGHTLWEDIFSGLFAMIALDSTDLRTQVLLFKTCEEYLLVRPWILFVPQCRRLLGSFFGTLTERPLVGISGLTSPNRTADGPISEVIWGDRRLEGTSHVCFDRLVAGTAPHSIVHYGLMSGRYNSGREPTFWLFRCLVLASFGLDCEDVPTVHQIVVVHKTAGVRPFRGMCDAAEVSEWVREAYPELVVRDVDWSTIRSPQDELAIWLNTTLVITPCGGVSLPMAFMPAGSHAIVMDYWNAKLSRTQQMDGYLWSHLPHLHVHSYVIQGPQDVQLETSVESYLSFRSRACVKVQRNRILDLVDGALLAMHDGMLRAK